MSTIAENLQAVVDRIGAAATQAGRRADEVQLLAVSKTFGPEAVLAAVRAGQSRFGENYLQEALDKIVALAGQGIEWHFIGPVQSNKTRPIAENFAWVHSVERLKIAQRLSEQRPAALGPLNICLQVNVSGEQTKSGCAPAELPELARAVAALPGVRLRGLMAIPEPAADEEQQRVPFRQLRALYDALRADGLDLDTLSMGMSGDMDAAIKEGATIVRVGSAIFGARTYKQT
ncbi:YggS family pyridoxal phosphate-dependent enzyme [Massilia arenosa]|uniref:Pyridoxal phosphate homeostasis protein n=1 Tax=Zemynaea arenosa TaxID=2561931 RepID=A0A4Y9RP59_9BURK|nr:YggS family pyridoxal phosphate-dependent enzyme [Massilia arenosa]TFW10642.1 YggS family pyridoxal phosphate-dependent enzyme [Massilia arenosa]